MITLSEQRSQHCARWGTEQDCDPGCGPGDDCVVPRLRKMIVDQPEPVPNGGRPIWDLVVEDMQARDHVGRGRYGTPLQSHNGRDALVDAYQEILDAAVYMRQLIEEREHPT